MALVTPAPSLVVRLSPLQEMLRCVQHYLAAGREETVDVVALQVGGVGWGV